MYYVNENSGATYKRDSSTVLDHMFITSNSYMSTLQKQDNNNIIRNCTASDHWPLILTLDIPPVKTSATNKPTETNDSITKQSAVNVVDEYATKMISYPLFQHSKFRTMDPNSLLSIFRTRFVTDSKNEDTYYCVVVTENGMSDLFLCGKKITENDVEREVIDYNNVSQYLKMFMIII